MHKTMAVARLEAFFEVNYSKMFGVALREVGEHDAWDVVNNTYVSLMEKEERGRGHYIESYGTSYDSYVYGNLYGTLKGMRKLPEEIADSAYSHSEDGETETVSYLGSIGITDDMSEFFAGSTAEIVRDFVEVCENCSADTVALVRAISNPADLKPSFLRTFFSTLRKAAKHDCEVVTAVEDFIRVYGVSPVEVNMCLADLGVQV